MHKILKISLIVLAFSLFIYSLTYFGASAKGSQAADAVGYSDMTYIGGTNVSNKTKDEARVLLETQWSEWAAKAEIELNYKEQSYLASAAANLTFLTEETIKSAIDGQKNDLRIAVDNLDKVLPETIMDRLNHAELERDLAAAISRLDEKISINLNSYLPEEERIKISSAVVRLEDENEEILAFVKSVPSIELAPEKPFSLGAFVEEMKVDQFSDLTYNKIASAIYQSVLPTNFIISERHISSQLPTYAEPGFEAKVRFNRNLDLVFINPNTTPYTFEFNFNETELVVVLKGAPLLYQYSIHTDGKQEFKPRTIKQYSPLQESGEKSVEVEGSPGSIVKVIRETRNDKGELLKTELLSEDFYPPVHRVEVHPLMAVVQKTTGGSEGDGTVDLPGAGEEPSDSQNSQNDAAPPVKDGNGPEEEAGQEDDGGLYGKPNEEPK
nr:VanW family protein [Mesobacillus subterraneus]